MRDSEFRSREKKVHKLGRDGLVERNETTGEEKRVSGRAADISFGRTREMEEAAGRRPGKKPEQQKRRKQPVPQAPKLISSIGAPEMASLPDAPEIPDTTPEMRTASDMPMLDPPPEPRIEEDYPRRKRRSPGKRRIYNQRDGSRLREMGESDVSPSTPSIPRTGKKRSAADFSTALRQNATAPPNEKAPFAPGQPPASDRRSVQPSPAHKPNTPQESVPEEAGGRLHFEEDQEPPKADGPPVKRPQTKTHLRFEDEPEPAENPLSEKAKTPTEATGTMSPSRRQRKQYEKAERRVEQTGRKLEKAQSKLPMKRRIYLDKRYDSETGKARRRLHFETETRPEHEKPSLFTQAKRLAKTAVILKVHSKIHEAERENTALEAAHKSELVAEQGAGRLLRWNRNRRHAQPYRAVRQAEHTAARARSDLAWQTALWEHPELQQASALAKWQQRRAIQKKYAEAAREQKQSARFARNVLDKTGKAVRAVAEYVAGQKTMLLLAAVIALVVTLFSTGLTACTAMFSGIQSSYLSAVYLANEDDICESSLYFTELETDLQINIDHTETNFPGYDEYRYSIGEISHNPYELLSYLSAAYGAFTFEDVRPEIDRLFGEKYQLTRTSTTETRYDADDQPYEVTILQTTLTVRRLADVISPSLTPEQADSYNVYMQSYGGRQAFGNPFDFPWLGNVSSAYSWRVHPINGGKNLHRGVDIAVAQGTAIHAVQDGIVLSAEENGDYGLCVLIGDAKGYQSRYAHCASLDVSVGQEVKRGDVIATVGSTGQSTGPHLHLEVLLNSEYLNPYFFVENGGSGGSVLPGTPGGPAIPDYSGEPMEDQTFEAMLTEAEKYLGYPYVWGGSSPATSFDCSGYVSWVLNHSGWDVGRLGVLGLESICTPVSRDNAKPGDLVFFANTYDAPLPGPTHVGIYVGNGRFIHCGNPISYANLSSSYWTAHFWEFGRLP